MLLQLPSLFNHFTALHSFHGEKKLSPIFGGGCIQKPKLFFMFMNPTGRNVSAEKNWTGIRAPRLGTKNIWKLFHAVGGISKHTLATIQSLKPQEWTPIFCKRIYEELAKNNIYVTNLAKCTQIDARPLKDNIFKEYLSLMHEEIALITPQHIITFGNQVSSIFLGKKITVSAYTKKEHEILPIKKLEYKVYPVFYPVGQGMRNIDKAIERINKITSAK